MILVLFFAAIGILVTVGWVLGKTGIVDFSLRIGPVGMNDKIRAVIDHQPAEH